MSTDKAQAKNTLKILPDGIIQLTQTGYQTLESVGQFQAKIDDITMQNHESGKKALVLVDMSAVTGHDPAAREEAKLRLNGNYDGLAIYGSSITIRMIVNWLIRLNKQENKVRFFDKRNDALDWLHNLR